MPTIRHCSWGLQSGNEFPELGFVGDMLVSSDTGCQVSVLVMQQTFAKSKEAKIGSSKYLMREDSYIALDISHKFTRVFPES